MPAEVDQMFSVREMPWHRQGQVLADYPQSFEEARILAGLDWEPEEAPAVYSVMAQEEFARAAARIVLDVPDVADDEAGALSMDLKLGRLWALHQDAMRQDAGFRRIYRSDTGATLSYQADSYTIIRNSEFGEILQAVVDQPQIKLETGGCLAGGRKVWMLAYLDEPIVLPGDKTYTLPYLALTSRHDGSGACALRATAVRIVCANTFSAAEAEGERTGATFSFVHRGDWRERIEDATAAVMGARVQFADYAEWAKDMLAIPVSARQEEVFITEFFPMPPEGMMTDRVRLNVEASRAAFSNLLDGPTVDGAGVRGTAYGLVQAAGEYADHVRLYRSWESRLNRSLLRHEPVKVKAAKLAREVSLA